MRNALLTLGLAALTTVGCVMPDDVSQMQKDMADVQQQLSRMRRSQTDAERLLEEVRTASDESEDAVTREEVADLTIRVEQALRQTAISEERINDLGRRLDRYSQELQQTRELARRGAVGYPAVSGTAPGSDPGDGTDTTGSFPSPPTGTPSGGDALPDPEALYNTAYADFSKGNYALAISGFEEYQERFSDSPLADNALYWIGECHFSQGSFALAVESFDRLLDLYPRSDKAAASNLKKALVFLEQNQISQAIVQLRYVVSAYSGTDEARIATDKLRHLGASP